jgi:hypothetical protein
MTSTMKSEPQRVLEVTVVLEVSGFWATCWAIAIGGLAATSPAAPAAAPRKKLRRPTEVFFGMQTSSEMFSIIILYRVGKVPLPDGRGSVEL